MRKTVLTGVLIASGFGAHGSAHADATFFIDETTDYTSSTGCANITNVNTITASLETQLRGEAVAWTGNRYVNGSAWATDFFEACDGWYGAGGQDNLYADNAVLTVFAGHGNAGTLNFHWPHPERVTSTFSPTCAWVKCQD